MRTPLDSITFSPQMIENIDQLLALFDKVSQGHVFKYNPFTVNSIIEEKRHFSPWFEVSRLNRVAEWVVGEFEQKIVRA